MHPYRSEAAKLDPLFEARLFATALGRLDELPLRLVEPAVHGSPFHDFMSSIEFKRATEQIPGFKEKVIGLLRPPKPSESATDSN